MKKKHVFLSLLVSVAMLGTSCMQQADRVSSNLSKEADNFNIVRKITVINCIKGDVLFQITGRISIKADNNDNQLEITVEDNGRYAKHFIGLSDNVTYVVEDLMVGANDVSKYHYAINFNPNMWIPVDAEYID